MQEPACRFRHGRAAWERRAGIVFAAIGLAAASGAGGAEPTAIAVEFRQAATGAYFLTADPAETARLEAGVASAGWARTGGRFGVYAGADDAPGTAPVCRFRASPAIGAGSVFYTADAAECELVKGSGAWVYEGIAFHVHPVSDGACPPGTTPVWRTFIDLAARGGPNHRYTVDATAQARTVAAGSLREGIAMCAPLSAADVEADAVRLLRQATFGPTPADLGRVLALGAAAWIDEQLAMPATPYADYAWVPAARPATCVDDRQRPVRPDSFCARDNYTLFPLQLEFFRQAIAQPDQLRARVAFALSQIFVTSGVDNGRNYAMRHYQQIFRDRAFGNFHDLMAAVTLSPVMGDYLDMANNNKANAGDRHQPERELRARDPAALLDRAVPAQCRRRRLQRDAAGRPIPTYDLDEIEGFARAFTGWTLPHGPGRSPARQQPAQLPGQHAPGRREPRDRHEAAARRRRRAGQPARREQDLAFAHANIFGHPNVGPFIGRQLIQKLVTSDPTPAYVGARGGRVRQQRRGHPRRPARGGARHPARTPRRAARARSTPATASSPSRRSGWPASAGPSAGAPTASSSARSRRPSASSSSTPLPSSTTTRRTTWCRARRANGPEFGILNTGTAIARANFATALVFTPEIAPDAAVYGATGTALDFSGWQATAADAGALADRLDRELLAGRMPPAMRSAIVAAVNAVPATNPLARARTAAWLVVTSPQYQVER